MRVEVYWNLNKDLFSVRALEGENKGRVITHTERVELVDVKLVVQASGQRRARREGQRNVHAFARGHWVDPTPLGADPGRRITYNPFVHDTFVWADDYHPVHSCHRLSMSIRGNDRPHVAVTHQHQHRTHSVAPLHDAA